MGPLLPHSIWYPVLAKISKALGTTAAGKLSDNATSQILQTLNAKRNDELKLLQSISKDVKDIKEGPYYAGVTWLNEAGKVGILEEERIRRIELAQEKFIDALGRERRDNFRLALIQYHIGICAFLLGQRQGQGTEFWYANAGDWLEKAYNSAMGVLEDAIWKYSNFHNTEAWVMTGLWITTLSLAGPSIFIPYFAIRGPHPERKFFKRIEPVYLFLNDIERFKAETPVMPLNFRRRLEDHLQQIESIKQNVGWGDATKGTTFSDKGSPNYLK